MINESNIIEAAGERLEKFGKVEIEPITDRLNPSSGTSVPDLVFIPKSGPNKDTVYIVEFKTTNAEILPDVLVSNARRYKRLIEEANPDKTVKYGLGSNGRVIVQGEGPEVEPLQTIHDANELVERIVNWSGAEAQELVAAEA
ncbi:MAG: hypothetical protein ACT4OT_04050 [Acidobacteriota bacterium]